MIHLLLTIYSIAWRLALPLLKRNHRTALGWQERTLHTAPTGPFDLWIQAASGGEAMLTNMIAEEFCETVEKGRSYRLLLTAGTKEGVDSLNAYADSFKNDTIEIRVAYFPFDAPAIMKKAFSRFLPRLVVLLETELWPAFLITARQQSVPVHLFNGRMSDKSAGTYAKFHRFFHTYCPDKVWAISDLDRDRFAAVMGGDRVLTMNNIKFDRVKPVYDVAPDPTLQKLLPKNLPFILLGSIRKEEEEQIVWTVQELLAAGPDITIGIFPKHIIRADIWQDLLHQRGISSIKRSEIVGDNSAGKVIIWDTFGELAAAYNLAQTTFIGGSLAKLGGQNFLEPLVFGLRPIIGPHWRNFAWVGREIVTAGLVVEVESKESLLRVLLEQLHCKIDKTATLARVQRYFDPKKGGTRFVCQHIIQKLDAIDKS